MLISGNNKSCSKVALGDQFNGGNCFGAHLTPKRNTCGQTLFLSKGFHSTERWLHKGI